MFMKTVHIKYPQIEVQGICFYCSNNL